MPQSIAGGDRGKSYLGWIAAIPAAGANYCATRFRGIYKATSRNG